MQNTRRSQWPHGLRRGFAAIRLLGMRVRIPTGHGCLSVVECCVLSGRGLCDGLITRPEESYRLCLCVCVCVIQCDQMKQKPSTSTMGC